jgi:hypothetical protein
VTVLAPAGLNQRREIREGHPGAGLVVGDRHPTRYSFVQAEDIRAALGISQGCSDRHLAK